MPQRAVHRIESRLKEVAPARRSFLRGLVRAGAEVAALAFLISCNRKGTGRGSAAEPSTQPLADAAGDPPNIILQLIIGKPRILQLKETPRKIQIPDEKVATYDVLSEREVEITGLRVGTTVLKIWFDDKNSPNGVKILSYELHSIAAPEAAGKGG